ncbi:MAG: divergent polysaccharide deacetylase family protein [Bauldia sp.]
MDDLTAPLGLAPSKKLKNGLSRLLMGGGAALVVAAVAVGWAVLIHDPRGSAPVAVAPVGKGPSDQTGSIRQGAGSGSQPAPADDGPGLVEITPAGELTDLGNGVTITDPNQEPALQLASAPNQDLIEEGPYGPLPRIGASGERPMQAYARPLDPGAAAGTIRIAIVVGGIGLGDSGTEAAIRDLPGAVTLAFAPYGENLAAAVGKARGAGHEILLQVPLEPYGYPRNDPGPHTLTVAAKTGQNLDRLHWLMSRITTYVGVVNYLGARFTSEAEKLEPVLDEVGRRGLLYLDDGSSGASRADKLAADIVPFARADVILDAESEAGPIDARLKQLEAIARERGYAIGFATAFPVSIGRIAAYAKSAADRGIVLVPITALVQQGRT